MILNFLLNTAKYQMALGVDNSLQALFFPVLNEDIGVKKPFRHHFSKYNAYRTFAGARHADQYDIGFDFHGSSQLVLLVLKQNNLRMIRGKTMKCVM